jgi:hypothetical protein
LPPARVLTEELAKLRLKASRGDLGSGERVDLPFDVGLSQGRNIDIEFNLLRIDDLSLGRRLSEQRLVDE